MERRNFEEWRVLYAGFGNFAGFGSFGSFENFENFVNFVFLGPNQGP